MTSKHPDAARLPGDEGQESLQRLRAMLTASPEDAELRLRTAQALVKAQATEAAEEVLAPLLNCSHERIWADAVVHLARLRERNGRHDEAAILWERLLATDVDHALARAHLARLQRALAPAAPPPRRPDATLMSPEGVVAARYEILRELGSGGTSTVFLARDSHLDLHVALKVLHPFLNAATRSDARQRFFREARLAAALRHPGVVAIYDLDESTSSLAMEYFPLGTLRQRLSQAAYRNEATPLVIDEIEQLTRNLLRTLAHVHGTGLVHGDLKPRNILLRDPGFAVLGDFGVARLSCLDATAEDSAGTPLYFAPEQLRGAPSTVRTDLFAIGAIIWEMSVGRPMRCGADLISGRFAAPALPPEAVAYLQTGHLKLDRVVARTTCEDPMHRPESAAQVLQLME